MYHRSAALSVTVTLTRNWGDKECHYALQVWFFQEQGSDVLKGEMPIAITKESVLKMKSKPSKPERKPTLHVGEIVQITDPAEQAALDRRCRDAEKMLAAG
jgi:hypothetical protein